MIQTQAEGAGAQEISRILAKGFTAAGYDVHTIFLFRRTAAFDRQPNTWFCAAQRPRGPVEAVRMLANLYSHLRTIAPDVVLCFQHYGNIIGSIVARLAGLRRIYANRTSSDLPRWIRAIDRLLVQSGIVKQMVVNSASVEREYDGSPAWYRSRIVRIDHGFEPRCSELTRAAARASFGLDPDAALLGCVARLHPGKNLAAAMKLLPGNPRWHLALAGQGDQQGELEDLASALGVRDRVTFAGELSPARIGDFLRTLDIFVFPSLAETFGLAPVEAAQAGVPVVANDLEVLREVLSVDDEACARFVDVNDTPAFERIVADLLANQAARDALTTRACLLATRYSLGKMAAGYLELIEESDPCKRRPSQPIEAARPT
jgi:glycosyltransferase involved in cell wall biosynthesis